MQTAEKNYKARTQRGGFPTESTPLTRRPYANVCGKKLFLRVPRRVCSSSVEGNAARANDNAGSCSLDTSSCKETSSSTHQRVFDYESLPSTPQVKNHRGSASKYRRRHALRESRQISNVGEYVENRVAPDTPEELALRRLDAAKRKRAQRKAAVLHTRSTINTSFVPVATSTPAENEFPNPSVVVPSTSSRTSTQDSATQTTPSVRRVDAFRSPFNVFETSMDCSRCATTRWPSPQAAEDILFLTPKPKKSCDANFCKRRMTTKTYVKPMSEKTKSDVLYERLIEKLKADFKGFQKREL